MRLPAKKLATLRVPGCTDCTEASDSSLPVADLLAAAFTSASAKVQLLLPRVRGRWAFDVARR
jgi:hypothetical protein